MSRPRTRNQWDEHYKNLLNEKCKNGGRGERSRKAAVEESWSSDDEESWSSDGSVRSKASNSDKGGKRIRGEPRKEGLDTDDVSLSCGEEDYGEGMPSGVKENTEFIIDVDSSDFSSSRNSGDDDEIEVEEESEKMSTLKQKFKVDCIRGGKGKVKLSRQERFRANTLGLIKFLLELTKEDTTDHHTTAEETGSALPLKFGFEEDPPLIIKSDREKEIDSLFSDLESGILETQADSCVMENVENEDEIQGEMDQSPAACCARGDHDRILDEQIGIVCKYCLTTILDIKYVLPEFYTPNPGRYDYYRKDRDESSQHSIGPIPFSNTADFSKCNGNGSVWDLIPGIQKELYPHQRQGFEFMWKNISADDGCIISHAPGTGKTRLAIVFLQAFLKLHPTSHPLIIAPKGMLLTWESEFLKWKVDIPFHNLNKKELSENEISFARRVKGCGDGPMSVNCMRLVKLAAWVSGGGGSSVLGISYHLFKNLVLDVKGEKDEGIKNLLLDCPGLLVLDEGHTPRNNNSNIWKALSKVNTQKRIILSGTPFQNNLSELYNTLSIVNPKLVNEFGGRKSHEPAGRKRWMNMTSSIGKDTNIGLKELRAMLDTFVHVHKGSILEESLPGLRDTLVFLHPTESQKILLEEACSENRSIFYRTQQVSLISVHPSLTKEVGKSLPLKRKKSEGVESVDEGVKLKFVMKLIRLADALGERVLIFSQFLAPLEFIKKQIKVRFGWKEGREVVYMDGQMDERQRQDCISWFNDVGSEAKVMFASERACSEGISLVGASRVVLLDTVWNPSVEKQAVSRAYRLGQKKVVYVYRLFTSGMEVKQYSRVVQKERISQLLFSPATAAADAAFGKEEFVEDKILEAMRGLERFGSIFEKIICQPKESDLIEIFGLVDQN